MGLFDEVKQNVTVRQAVELYGLKPNRSGLIRCIFHNDKSPSMKVDRSSITASGVAVREMRLILQHNCLALTERCCYEAGR